MLTGKPITRERVRQLLKSEGLATVRVTPRAVFDSALESLAGGEASVPSAPEDIAERESGSGYDSPHLISLPETEFTRSLTGGEANLPPTQEDDAPRTAQSLNDSTETMAELHTGVMTGTTLGQEDES